MTGADGWTRAVDCDVAVPDDEKPIEGFAPSAVEVILFVPKLNPVEVLFELNENPLILQCK